MILYARLSVLNVVKNNKGLCFIRRVLRPFNKFFTGSWLFNFYRKRNHVQGHAEVPLQSKKGSNSSHGSSLVPVKWQGTNVNAEKPLLANCYSEAAVSLYSISLHFLHSSKQKNGKNGG